MAAKPALLIDNEQTRVTRWFFEEAGSATGWHRHEFDYVVIPLFNGFLGMKNAKGEATKVQLSKGVPYFRRAGVEHDVINVNDFPCSFLEIEFLK